MSARPLELFEASSLTVFVVGVLRQDPDLVVLGFFFALGLGLLLYRASRKNKDLAGMSRDIPRNVT